MFSENLTVPAILFRLEKVLSIAEIRDFSLFIVSNDVNEGVPIQDLHVMRYISCLEALHKRIVKASDTVIETICGTPVVWKRNGILSPYVSFAEGGQI
jgi:adenosylcobinamide kinase/adenosylcobinamide-phosphate guanylyltransferase